MQTPSLSRGEITNIRRRLDKWELAHLRSHAASLDDQLQAAIRRADLAEQQAESWRDHAMELQEELIAAIKESGAKVGLTEQGNIVALRPTCAL